MKSWYEPLALLLFIVSNEHAKHYHLFNTAMRDYLALAKVT